MKTWKQGIIGIIVLALAFTACNRKSGTATEGETVEAVTESSVSVGETATTEQIVIETMTNGHIDITKIIRQEAIFLGIFGDKYQKMGIAFLTITRINDTQFEVKGKSKLENNVNDFRGTIEVQSQEERRNPSPYGFEEIDGKAVGKYLFEEDRSQPSTGIFEGTFEIIYVLTGEDLRTSFTNVSASDIQVGADFIGNWKSYRSGATYTANWGNLNTFEPIRAGYDGSVMIREEYRSSGWAFELDRLPIYIESNWNENEAQEKIRNHPDYAEWFEWWK